MRINENIKTLVLTGVLLTGLFCHELWGQEKVLLTGGQMQNTVSVTSGEISGQYRLSHFEVYRNESSDSAYIQLSLQGAYPSAEPGTPEIPVFSKLLEADPSVHYSLEIDLLDSTVLDLEQMYPGSRILPVRQPVRKNEDRQQIAIRQPDDDQYEPAPLVSYDFQGMLRGIGIARVRFNPFRYNAANNSLTVYHEIDFRLVPDRKPALTGTGVEEDFLRAVPNVVLDSERSVLKRIVSEKPVTLVILSDTLFKEALQPLVSWKTLKGFNVIEAYTSDPEVGDDNASIRSYMQSLYTDPPPGISPPSYLLIAGDVEHVPLSQSSGQVTDLYYTTFDGPGDYLPEMFHGRISVKNETQLIDVVDKILMYEQYRFPDPSFLDRSVLIAGYDAGYAPLHGNGQIRYAEKYYYNLANGIDSRVYLHPDAASLDQQILGEIGNGAALVNYTGHGEYYGWLDPAFRLSHIDSLGNLHQYGLMIGNGCSTNQFNLPTKDCFAEAVLKVKDRGAVGYIGCTNDSYWDEDYYWTVGVGPIRSDPLYEETGSGYYDKLFHSGNEPLDQWAPSMGEMIFSGNMTVQESTSDKKKYYWEIYQLMGDPTLVPWFRQPGAPEVRFPQGIPLEATQMSVEAAAYDYVALSSKGRLITAKHCDGFGQVLLELPDTLTVEELVIVVTGDYRQPFIDTISRINSRRGYMELADYRLTKESVVTDGAISVGEAFSLDIDLLNSSGKKFHSQSLTLSCNDGFIAVTDSVVQTGYIEAGETVTLENVFRIHVNDPPGDLAAFNMRIRKSAGDDGNVIFINERVHAASLVSRGIQWDDRTFGNGNGIIEAGERIRFRWNVQNAGSYASDSLRVSPAATTEPLITGFDSNGAAGISSGDSEQIVFSAILSLPGGVGIPETLTFGLTDEYVSLSESLLLVTGKHFDDFSTGDLSGFNWATGPSAWIADSTEYSAAPWSMKSGSIGHGEQTSLSIEVCAQQTDTLLFDYRVSSEKNYDFLEFYADSIRIARWSGITDWSGFAFALDTGTHLLEWRYVKDSNTTKGKDAAWIDNVVFPSRAFDSIDLGLLNITSPLNSSSLSLETGVVLQVINTGFTPVHGYSISSRFENGSTNVEDRIETLQPGEIVSVTLPVIMDLSEPGVYRLDVGILAEGDVYPGNDAVAYDIEHYRYPDLALELTGIDSTGGKYADLRVNVVNQGNVYMESMAYTYHLNSELVRNDTLIVMLGPGQYNEFPIPIIGNNLSPETDGWQNFVVTAAPDSMNSNNQVEGDLYWVVRLANPETMPGITVYPNPAAGYFTIGLERQTSGPLKIDFLTLDGSLLHSGIIRDRTTVFDSDAIFSDEGLFLFRVFDEDGSLRYAGKILVSGIRGN